jgi:hypothetical protein
MTWDFAVFSVIIQLGSYRTVILTWLAPAVQ